MEAKGEQIAEGVAHVMRGKGRSMWVFGELVYWLWRYASRDPRLVDATKGDPREMKYNEVRDLVLAAGGGLLDRWLLADEVPLLERSTMAKEGDVLENPVTGQRLIFRKAARDTGGDLLEVESVYTMPTPSRPSVHYHPYQEERFEVLSGEDHTRIDGEECLYGAGEVFTIPPGMPHTMWAEQGGVRVNWRTRPALKTEAFFETSWALARAGKVNDSGVPNLLQAAVIAREYEDEYSLAKPPWPLQKAFLAVLAPIGGLLGYEAPWQKRA